MIGELYLICVFSISVQEFVGCPSSPSGSVQVRPGPSRSVRVRPGPSGSVRVRLGPSGPSGPSGSVRVRPSPSESVQIRPFSNSFSCTHPKRHIKIQLSDTTTHKNRYIVNTVSVSIHFKLLSATFLPISPVPRGSPGQHRHSLS